jgi:hypothetical protein
MWRRFTYARGTQAPMIRRLAGVHIDFASLTVERCSNIRIIEFVIIKKLKEQIPFVV